MALGGGATIIFLHVTHLLLAIITIVGLHLNSQMYDLKGYLDNKAVIDNNTKSKLPGETREENLLYFTGALWAGIVGLLGLLALAVLILSFIFSLPKLIQWYYLACSILLFLVASLGLGLNGGVHDYAKCRDNPKTERKYACGTNYYFPAFVVYVISIAHVLAYLAAFLVTLFGDGSSGGSGGLFGGLLGGGGDSKNQAAQKQEQFERERQERERLDLERQPKQSETSTMA